MRIRRSAPVLKRLLERRFFFFKQKAAYEVYRGLVGSEMCIRDRTTRVSIFAGIAFFFGCAALYPAVYGSLP